MVRARPWGDVIDVPGRRALAENADVPAGCWDRERLYRRSGLEPCYRSPRGATGQTYDPVKAFPHAIPATSAHTDTVAA